MPTKDHPEDLAGVPYIFPDWLDRVQATFVTPLFIGSIGLRRRSR